MTTATRNRPAERLRRGMPKPLHPILAKALAAEHRATLHALGKRFDNELGVTVEVAKVLRIIAEERDR